MIINTTGVNRPKVYLMYGLYTDDFIDAWVTNRVMEECFVDLRAVETRVVACYNALYGIYKERLRAGCRNFPEI